MAFDGRRLIISIDVGTEAAPDNQVLASQTDATCNLTATEIDVSSKDSSKQRFLPGVTSETIETGTFIVRSDVAWNRLLTAARTQTSVNVNKEYFGNIVETARAIVTALSERYPTAAGAASTITLRIDGGWVAA